MRKSRSKSLWLTQCSTDLSCKDSFCYFPSLHPITMFLDTAPSVLWGWDGHLLLHVGNWYCFLSNLNHYLSAGWLTFKTRFRDHQLLWVFASVFQYQFSSVAQSCPTLCNPINRSTPGLPVHHQLSEFTQTQVHQVSDAIQPSHPLSSPSPSQN